MNEQLIVALNVLLEIKDAQGLNAKRDLLIENKSNNTLQDILYFVFNPYIRTGIGWSKLNKMEGPIEIPNDVDMWTIQGTFTYLEHNNTGRDKDIIRVMQFVETKPEKFKSILYDIFTKSLKLGISTTTINRVFNDLIPGFGVQLACKWQDNIDMLRHQEIFVTEKLDGNRCFAQVKNHQVTFYSRSGREIEGLNDVAEELSRLVDGWYDGELLASTFNETQSTIRKKGNKKDVVFNIFDYVSEYEVQQQRGLAIYSARRQALNEIFQGIEKFKYNKVVPIIYQGKFDSDLLLETLSQYVSNGSEGLMINLNSTYQFGRTDQLLKVKNMNTIDLRIIGMQEGRGEFANTCGALVVEYKGYTVGVGSGLSKFDREYFWNNKSDIIGKIAEIQYFEETKDQNGHLSLRFPVFKQIRTDKDEISYN